MAEQDAKYWEDFQKNIGEKEKARAEKWHPKSKFETLDQWKEVMTKGNREYMEEKKHTLEYWLEWRMKAWDVICSELSGSTIEDFEEWLDDPEAIRALSNIAPVAKCVRVPEINKFIKQRIRELKKIEKESIFEEIWEYHE